MTIKRVGTGLVLASVATVLAWGAWSGTTDAAVGGDTIRIGVINSVTGPFTVYSDPVRDGLQIALDEINAKGGIRDRKVELIVHDDEGKPEVAAAAFEKLAKSGVSVVIGPITSGTTHATMALANQYGVVQVSPIGHSPQLAEAGPFTFMILPASDAAARGKAALVLQRFRPTRVAYLGDSSPLATGANQAWREELEAAGVELAVEERFALGDKSFKTQLQKVKDAKVDLLVFPGYYEDETVGIVEQARELGIKVPLVGTGMFCADAIETLSHTDVTDIYVVEEAFGPQLSPGSKNPFVNKYLQVYGRRPGMEAAAAHSALTLVAEAIEAGGYSAKDIQTALRTASYQTTFGPVRYGSSVGGNLGAGYALTTLRERVGVPVAVAGK